MAVINEAFAREYLGAEAPIGRSITLDAELGAWEIIGVAEDVRVLPRTSPGPEIYLPYMQFPHPKGNVSLLLRLNEDRNAALDAAVNRAVSAVDPLIRVQPLIPLSEQADRRVARERATLHVLRALSALALILSAFGLFSVLSYTVALRRRELAVRIAIGAQPRTLMAFVMHRGLKLVMAGTAGGLAFSLALARLLQNILFETSPLDPVTYVAVAAIMLLTGALACWLPARRAVKVDPIEALRAE